MEYLYVFTVMASLLGVIGYIAHLWTKHTEIGIQTKQHAIITMQEYGTRMIASLIKRFFDEADGLVSIEATLICEDGRQYVVDIHRPRLESVDGHTVETFLKLITPIGEAFVPDNVRLVLHYNGLNYVVRFDQHQLQSSIINVLEVAKKIAESTYIESRAIKSKPVRVTLEVIDKIIGKRTNTIDVTSSVSAMCGPKGRWWNGKHETTRRSILYEAFRAAFHLRTGGHVMKNMLTNIRIAYIVKIQYASGIKNYIRSTENDNALNKSYDA